MAELNDTNKSNTSGKWTH